MMSRHDVIAGRAIYSNVSQGVTVIQQLLQRTGDCYGNPSAASLLILLDASPRQTL